MKNVHTVPLEVLSAKANGAFATEPHEADWAEEALALVYVCETAGPAPKLVLQAQISADGACWMNHATPPLVIDRPGAHCLSLERFGNWLRFAGEVSGGPVGNAPAAVIDLYLVLKG